MTGMGAPGTPAAPTVPGLDDPLRAIRHAEHVERTAVRQAGEWLAHQAIPEDAVIWYPYWDATRPTAIDDAVHLARLIAALHADSYGGVQRLKRQSRRLAWAQVRRHESENVHMIELWPADPEVELPGPAVFERVLDITASAAAALAWAWVTEGRLLDGYEVQMRQVPASNSFAVLDQPL